MKKIKNYSLLFALFFIVLSCQNNDDSVVSNSVTLEFQNTFKENVIVLGDSTSTTATKNISAEGQSHYFSELKYVISNIRLVKTDGAEIPYHINDLDKGATVIDQSKSSSLNYVLNNIPAGEYKRIKFGLGIKPDLNKLDQVRFPQFYANAGANDTKMHWEWGTGYRFTKIEGFYENDNQQLSIHTGSTVEGTNGDSSSYTQGVDAYREITLDLTTNASVSRTAPKIIIRADFDKLLSGKVSTIKLGTANATPSVHTAANMVQFVNNLGGDGTSDVSGMFSILKVEN